jgi:hypothetical protein
MRQPTYRCSQGIALVGPCTGPLGSPLRRNNRIPGHRIPVTSGRRCRNRLLVNCRPCCGHPADNRPKHQAKCDSRSCDTQMPDLIPGIRLRERQEEARRLRCGRPRGPLSGGCAPCRGRRRAWVRPPAGHLISRRCRPGRPPSPPSWPARGRRAAAECADSRKLRNAIPRARNSGPAINPAARVAGANRALSCIVRAISRRAVVSVWSLLGRHSGWRSGGQPACPAPLWPAGRQGRRRPGGYRGGGGAAVARSSSAARPGGTRAVSLVPSSPWSTVSTSPS